MCIGVIFWNLHAKNRVSFIEKTQFTCKNKGICRNSSYLLELTIDSCRNETSINRTQQFNWGNWKESMKIFIHSF